MSHTDSYPRYDLAEDLEKMADFLTVARDQSVVSPWLLREAALALRASRESGPKRFTPEQIEARQHSFGGSDCNRLMNGGPRDVQDLLDEKCGLKPPKDLSDVLIVELGIHTERLNREWFTKQTGRPVTIVNDPIVHRNNPWMIINVDGKSVTQAGQPAVLEAKYSSGRLSLEVLLEKYYPQLQYYMEVTGLSWAVLSVIFGDGTWKTVDVPFDWHYRDRLLEEVKLFWDCRMSNPPQRWPKLVAAEPPDNILEILKLSKPCYMGTNNEWCSLAPEWRELKESSRRFDEVSARLKALVNREVRMSFARGVMARVDRRGVVTLIEDKDWDEGAELLRYGVANDDELTY